MIAFKSTPVKAHLWSAPDYISDLLTAYKPECSLTSSDRGVLVIHRSTLTQGRQSPTISGVAHEALFVL